MPNRRVHYKTGITPESNTISSIGKFEEDFDTITVGEVHIRKVTQADHDLYVEIREVIEDAADRKHSPHHIGLVELGDLATHLTNKYTLTKKVT